MKKILSILCDVDEEKMKEEIEKIIYRLSSPKEEGMIPRLDREDFSIKFSNLEKEEGNFYDLIIIHVKKGEYAIKFLSKILLTVEKNSKSQLLFLCDINPKDFICFGTLIKATNSFYFGTAFEAFNRIIEMIYLKKRGELLEFNNKQFIKSLQAHKRLSRT